MKAGKPECRQPAVGHIEVDRLADRQGRIAVEAAARQSPETFGQYSTSEVTKEPEAVAEHRRTDSWEGKPGHTGCCYRKTTGMMAGRQTGKWSVAGHTEECKLADKVKDTGFGSKFG